MAISRVNLLNVIRKIFRHSRRNLFGSNNFFINFVF